MTTATPSTDPMRKVALAGGVAYLVTFAASIPQLALFADLVADPAGFIATPGSHLGDGDHVRGWEQVSLAGGLCALPIAVWEFSLGVWLTVKGFRTTPAPATDHEVLPVG